jgi:predicted small secreted protein
VGMTRAARTRALLVLVVVLVAGLLAACDTLNPGDVMRAGSSLTSANGAVLLVQQSDGNLVLGDACGASWSSGTWGHPGAWTVMQSDGNLVVYAADGHPLWWSGTNGHPGAHLVVQNDGNLVIYHGTYPLWATFTKRCLFTDDFSGTGLDHSKWQPNWFGATDASITHMPGPPGSTGSCFDPALVGQPGDGFLHLAAVNRTCTTSETPSESHAWTSSNVSTNDRFAFTYGRLEARMWLPPDGGPVRNWPGFWATGVTVPWPQGGEIDVMEGSNGKACWHFHADLNNDDDPSGCPNLTNPSGWHTFAANWTPNRVDYYYDNRLVGSVTSQVTGYPMIIDLQHGIHADQTPREGTVLVDYVHVDANAFTR